MASKEPCSVVHWFRKGLRLHDNPALLACLKPIDGSASDELPILRPVYIIDPWFTKNIKCGHNRRRFFLQTLQDLDCSLRKLGSRLYVARGDPELVFGILFTKWNVKRITWEEDSEPYSKERDARISLLAAERGIEFETRISHTLYNPESIVAHNLGSVPLTMQKLTSVVQSIGHPAKTVEAPNCLENFLPQSLDDAEYNLPTSEELDIDESQCGPCLYPGGESEALRRLDDKVCFEKAKWVREFEKPQTSPNSLEPSTTVLSPYLKYGCLSARTFYWRLIDVYSGAKHSKPPVSLMAQLYWREFFYTAGSQIKNFDKMKGNAICKQIPWDNNPTMLEAWANAKTGYPFIDAIMTQLRTEGWVHHLARHSVACFLTRGDLWQSWEKGKEVFEELLLDADWSLNAANWMWLSASSFFRQYFRVYSPIAFGKKTDPNGDYIRKYLPQLRKFPNEYIYEPWNAPFAVQKAAGCIVGTDYPKRIVEHSQVPKQNLGRMKRAYADNSKTENSNMELSPVPSKKQKSQD